jgi:RimJ/RimL family protein N-acetyltransferase
MHIHVPPGRATLQPCGDVDLLSGMYTELMEDEQSDAHRLGTTAHDGMAALLRSGEVAYTFHAEGRLVGYALVNVSRAPFYLHHFYICRDARRQGYGTEAFHALLAELGTVTIDLDVFVWNERGKAFWTSLGFTPRATIMRYRTSYDHD